MKDAEKENKMSLYVDQNCNYDNGRNENNRNT